MNLFEKRIKENIVFNGHIFQVNHDSYLLPDGQEAYREVVYHHGGVCIACIDNDEMYFVRQYRCPYDELVLEFPAGKIELDEEPEKAIIREAKEEIGADINSLHSLGVLYPTPGYCSEKIYLYYSDDFTLSNQKLDKDEFLNVEKYSFNDALKMVMSGEIKDSKTQCIILKLAVLRGEKL